MRRTAVEEEQGGISKLEVRQQGGICQRGCLSGREYSKGWVGLLMSKNTSRGTVGRCRRIKWEEAVIGVWPNGPALMYRRSSFSTFKVRAWRSRITQMLDGCRGMTSVVVPPPGRTPIQVVYPAGKDADRAKQASSRGPPSCHAYT